MNYKNIDRRTANPPATMTMMTIMKEGMICSRADKSTKYTTKKSTKIHPRYSKS